MAKMTYPLYYGDKLMPWSKGTVIKDFRGLVFLSGTEGIDPQAQDIKLLQESDKQYLSVVPGAEAQTRMAMEKIKARLEEMGSSLDNIVKMICYVVGPDFPEGVSNHPTWVTASGVINSFFAEHAPELCFDKNPVARDLIGVSGLGAKDMVIEIAVVAVIE